MRIAASDGAETNSSSTMKNAALLLIASLFVLKVGAQSPLPRPVAELQKLEVWTGKWKYEGTAYKTPLGDGGKFRGSQTGRMILNGSFVELRWQDKGDFGNDKGSISEGLDVYGYDSAKKTYTVVSFERDGATTTGTLTVDGNTWRQASVRTASDGKSYQNRYVMSFSDGGKRVTTKCEYSVDGVNWMPSWDGVMTKTGKAR